MNGLEVAQEILKNDTQAKIIAMSSLTEEWLEQQVNNAGCRAFLKKPFNQKAIMSAYERALQGRQDVKYGGV
jgi:CheY-like chemotaxis protein